MKVSQSQLQTLVDAIPIIAWRAHADGRIELWDNGWHDYTGLSPENSAGFSWQAVIHVEDLRALTNKWQADHADGSAGEIEVRLRRFDGEYR